MTEDRELDALLEAVEGIEVPSPETAERGKTRLLAALAAGTAGTAAGSASASTVATATGPAGASVTGSATAALVKPLAVVLLVTGAATAPLWGPSLLLSTEQSPAQQSPEQPVASSEGPAESMRLPSSPARMPTSSAAPATSPTPASARVETATPARERTEALRSSGPAARARAARTRHEVGAPQAAHSAVAVPSLEATTPTDSAEESAFGAQELGTELLRRAIRLQDRGDHAEALRLIDAHRLRFPNATLHVEREAIAIGALCALGRRSEAEARRQRIRGERDAAYLTRRIRRHCD